MLKSSIIFQLSVGNITIGNMYNNGNNNDWVKRIVALCIVIISVVLSYRLLTVSDESITAILANMFDIIASVVNDVID